MVLIEGGGRVPSADFGRAFDGLTSATAELICQLIQKPLLEVQKMPIYEYQCTACCHMFEHLALSASDPAPECPECECGDVVKLMSAGAVRPHGIPSGSGGFKAPACKPAGG
jgi:putative FmdB family regulatory protein